MTNIKKLFPLLCCLLSVGLASGEKKINLEDIENENLANERQRQYKQKFVYVQQEAPVRYVTPQVSSQPQVQYGFRPMKTEQEYQQQPVNQNVDAEQYTAQQYSEQLPNEPQYVVQPKPTEQFYYNTNQLLQDNNNLVQPYYQPQLVYLQPQTAATNTIQTEPENKGGIQYVMYVPTPYLPEAKGEPSQAVQTVQEYTQDYTQQYPTQEGRSEQQVQYVEVPVPASQTEVEYQQPKEKPIQPHYLTQQQIQIPQPVRYSQEPKEKQIQPHYLTQQQIEIPQPVRYSQEPKEKQIQPHYLTQQQIQIPQPVRFSQEKQIQQQYLTQQQIQIPQPVRFGQKSHLPRPKTSLRPYDVDRVPNYEYMAQKYKAKSLVDSYIPSVLQLQYMKQQHQQAKPLHEKTHINLAGQLAKPRPSNVPKKGYLKNFVNDFVAAAQNHNYRYATPQRYYVRQ